MHASSGLGGPSTSAASRRVSGASRAREDRPFAASSSEAPGEKRGKNERNLSRQQPRGCTQRASSLAAFAAMASANPADRRPGTAAVRLCTLSPMTELRLVLEDPQEGDLLGNQPNRNPDAQTTVIKVLRTDGPGGSRGRSPRSREEEEAPRGSLRGTAEIFGAELLPEVDYPLLPGSCLAVFSWGGCTLQLRGRVQQEYTAPNGSMKDYLALSSILDARRQIAALRRAVGPRVLVVGSSCSGKSSICSVLANYAIRSGWSPMYVELDPRGSADKPQVQLPPGCLGATVLDSLNFLEEPEFPLVYFYGRTEPPAAQAACVAGSAAPRVTHAPGAAFPDFDGFLEPADAAASSAPATHAADLFEWYCECLSANVYAAFAQNLQEKHCVVKAEEEKEGDVRRLLAASGMLINAPPLANLALVSRLLEIFNVDLVLVVDNPSLLRALQDVCSFEEPANENIALSRLLSRRPRAQTHAEGQAPAGTDAQVEAKTAEGGEGKPDEEDDEEDFSFAPNPRVEVIGLKKMEGAVTVDNARLRQLRRSRVLSYFLGLEGGTRLRPQTLRLRLSEYSLVQLEVVKLAPLSALPADYVRSQKQSPIAVSPWTGNPLSLANALLGVPATRDPALVKFSNVACLLHVFKVEEMPSALGENEGAPTYVMDVHSPALPGGQLPSNFLIVPGDLKGMKFFLDLN
ncbi:polynucleotide 5'-hydroxyl-kinase [Toxoplasma gondii ARI]|uniref:Polynucleotide 5'-hydroxyl-kinase n=1 Tax=Toxoplasma gondii ARI TaxID=1074872 RepID=A0A139XLP4_TOXGO|nr:polynucleotide 5'-hydroxyl-kinase [Toxoplasma gondii ARI]